MSVVLPTSSRLGAESVCSAQTSVPRREVSVNTELPSEAQFKYTNLKSLSIVILETCMRNTSHFVVREELSLFLGCIYSYTAGPNGRAV